MARVLVPSLVIGAVAAVGVLLVVRELLPATPALGASLRRLHPQLSNPATGTGGVLRSLARRFPVPREELALLERTTRHYYTTLAVAGYTGLALPVVAGVMLIVSGRGVPGPLLGLGAVASLALAVLFMLVAHRDVRFKAAQVRGQFRPAIAAYLSLVAMERAAGHGSVESLERAAAVGDGPAIRRIRDALARARSHHRPPWDELRTLGARLGVAEVGDIGQIMHSSGMSGAQVHRTLLQRADSLRDQIRTDALAQAERTTSKLELPGAMLLFILAIYFLYPVTQQIEV